MKNLIHSILFLSCFLLNAQTPTENYIKTTTYLIETLDGNVTEDQKIESVTYYDGLNREKQSISLRSGGNRQDIVTPIVYDQFGRVSQEYLPLPVSNNEGNYYSGNIEASLKSFYRAKFPGDFYETSTAWDNPYFEKSFEESPLNRVIEQGAPGHDWRLYNGGEHSIKKIHSLNASEEVKKFIISYDTNNKPKLIFDGYYEQETLFKSTTRDENWTSGLLNTTETFTDKNGKTLLTNSYILENGNPSKVSTYFVYDDLGRLIYKLTPKQLSATSSVSYADYLEVWNVSDFLEPGSAISGTVRFEISDNLINVVHFGAYDPNIQGILKSQTIKSLSTVPALPDMHLGPVMGITNNNTSVHIGNAKIENGNFVIDRISSLSINFLVFDFSVDLSLALGENDMAAYAFQYRYDHYNRLIEQKTPGRGWEYLVYDKLDRPILSQDINLKNQNKWLFTKYDVFGRTVYTGIFNSSSSRETLQAQVDGLSSIFENRVTTPLTLNGTSLYYSNQAFPTTNLEIHTVNYYDTYVDHTGLSLPASTFGVSRTLNTQGLPTVSKVRVLNTDQWITTLSTYDDKGRVIYTDSKNDFLNSRDIARLKLDFTGNMEETHTSHLKAGKSTMNIKDYFHYDHIDRLKSHKQKIDNEPVQLISENFYDELGQLYRKDVGGETVLDGYTDIVNIDVTFDGTISHTSNNWNWPSRLKTKGAIVEDGGITFKLVGINNHTRVGLLKPQNSNSSNDYLDYGFYLQYVGTTNTYSVNVINNGSLQSTTYTYSPGDIFKVERIGNEVKYFRNGSIISTVTYVGNNESLTSKVSFSGPGGSIENVSLYGPSINKKLQNINYKYNVRGWLTDINHLGGLIKNPPLFSLKINYNKPIEGNAGDPDMTVPLYNGNISQITWKTENDDSQKHSYGYKYDALNRLKTAYSRKGSDLNTEDFHSLNNVNYDRNGNITFLSRNGFIQGASFPLPWDDLLYTYEGNQLVSVTDLSNSEAGFNGKPVTGSASRMAAYTYDANGNLKSDTGKNIVNVSYNHLDLPVSVTILDDNQEGGYITYVYDATGVKLSKTFTPTGVNPNGIETQYDGNFIYEKMGTGENELQFFSHAEGYTIPVDEEESVIGFDAGPGTTTYSSYSYVFQYKDHLGNVRLSYSDLDLNGSIDPNVEIIEENNYYPFGLKHKGYNTAVTSAGNNIAQQYKFGGKQLQEELGLQWYDFGARNYDAATGRWFNTDPQNQFASPYLYAFNNPVIAVDPDGEFAWIVVAAAVGGVVNLASNAIQGNINSWGDGFAAFGSGAAAGALATFGPAGWAAGGAIVGGTNSYLSGADTFGEIAQGSMVGAVSGLAGGAAGQWASNSLGNLVINGLNVTSPVAKGVIGGAIGGGVGGYAGGFTGGFITSGDINQANNVGLSGLATGFGIGATAGGVSSYASAKANGIDPWTGVKKDGVMIGGPQLKVNSHARDLNVETIENSRRFEQWPSDLKPTLGGRLNPEALDFNSRWINDVIDSNSSIYNINRPGGHSTFYHSIEMNTLIYRNYNNIIDVGTIQYHGLRFSWWK